ELHARSVLYRFPSRPKSERSNLSAPLRTQDPTRFSKQDWLPRSPQTQREIPPRDRVFVLSLYLCPLSPFRTPTRSQQQWLPGPQPVQNRDILFGISPL